MYFYMVILQAQCQYCWKLAGYRNARATEGILAHGFSQARLEAPQLHTCALAMGKLRVDDVNLIRAFQKEVLADLSALHSNSLPPVLDSGSWSFTPMGMVDGIGHYVRSPKNG